MFCTMFKNIEFIRVLGSGVLATGIKRAAQELHKIMNLIKIKRVETVRLEILSVLTPPTTLFSDLDILDTSRLGVQHSLREIVHILNSI